MVFFTFGDLNRYRDQSNTKDHSSLLSELLRGDGVPFLALASILSVQKAKDEITLVLSLVVASQNA